MESTAVFEVELSVTFIRCRPDAIHLCSAPVHRQEVVRLLPPLSARGTKGPESPVEPDLVIVPLPLPPDPGLPVPLAGVGSEAATPEGTSPVLPSEAAHAGCVLSRPLEGPSRGGVPSAALPGSSSMS